MLYLLYAVFNLQKPAHYNGVLWVVTAGNFCSSALVTFQSLQRLPSNLTVAAGLGCHKDSRKVSKYVKTD